MQQQLLQQQRGELQQREHRKHRDRRDDGGMPRDGAHGRPDVYKDWVCDACMPRGLSYLRLQDKLHSDPGPMRRRQSGGGASPIDSSEVDPVPWFVDLMNFTSPAFRRMQASVPSFHSSFLIPPPPAFVDTVCEKAVGFMRSIAES